MNIYERALIAHANWRGKLEILSKAKVSNADELSLAYSPGVAEPCRKIAEDREKVWAISVPTLLCQLWKARQFSSRNLAVLMLFPSA
jgi:malic enzyme